ncbi:MAG: CRTAC1 family protein, partial [Anaerolineae bacterium]
VAPALGLDVPEQAGGVIVDDFTGDGNLDVMMSSIGVGDQIRFFASRGDGTFEERTSQAGLTGLVGGLNIIQADYDGDGWLDFLILRGGWSQQSHPYPNSLVRNRGDGTFEDVTEAAGMKAYHPTQTAAWGDYDNDGDLDVFIGNETSLNGGATHPCLLYSNDGDGTFTEIGEAAGVSGRGFTKSAVFGDYDNDGRLDLYLSRLAEPNVLYHNDGPGADGRWHFSDVAAKAGVQEPLFSFPSWWFDYDNDGWLDLFVSGYGLPNPDADMNLSAAAVVAADYLGLPTTAARLHLYHNRRDGTFEEVAAKAGIARVIFTMGCNFGDLDNDGFEDFYLGTGNPDFRSLMPNRMFRNVGDGTFHDVTTAGGFGVLQKGHAISFADLDNDGDQDVYADFGGAFDGDWYPNVVFENPGHGHHWATLRLTGPDKNTRAIGARVTVRWSVYGGPRTLTRVVGSGGSFGGNSLQVELGLGDATKIDSVSILWPGAAKPEEFSGVGMDGFWSLKAGSGKAEPVKQAAFKLGGGVVTK